MILVAAVAAVGLAKTTIKICKKHTAKTTAQNNTHKKHTANHKAQTKHTQTYKKHTKNTLPQKQTQKKHTAAKHLQKKHKKNTLPQLHTIPCIMCLLGVAVWFNKCVL